MQREQIEQAAEGMMQMALDNLERDGYVAFGALLVSKNGIMPLILERVDAEQKERLGEFLRACTTENNIKLFAKLFALAQRVCFFCKEFESDLQRTRKYIFLAQKMKV